MPQVRATISLSFPCRHKLCNHFLGEDARAEVHGLFRNDHFLDEIFARDNPAYACAGGEYFGKCLQIDNNAPVLHLLVKLVDGRHRLSHENVFRDMEHLLQ